MKDKIEELDTNLKNAVEVVFEEHAPIINKINELVRAINELREIK